METLDRNVFGSQEIAYECLADVDRTRNFMQAIDEVVKKDSAVIEMGTGTGILSLFAARAGGYPVHAYEIEKPMAEIARQNIRENNYDHIIEVYDADVTKVSLKKKTFYDVLIAEMISVGLIEEQLIPAFNNILHQGILKDTAVAMPSANQTFVELVNTDFDHFGINLKTIQIEQTWQESKIKHFLTNPELVSYVDFNNAIAQHKPINPLVDNVIEFTAKQSGAVNAIRLTSDSILSPKVISGWTQCMNSPAVLPLKEFKVKKGQKILMRVKYEMGGEMKSFSADIV